MPESPIRVALLGYDGVQTLDLVGPLDAFDSASQSSPGAYACTVTSVDGAPFTSEAGLSITPACSLIDAGPIDTLIVPGGVGTRRPAIGDALVRALRRRAPDVRRIVSVCTGIYVTAAAGLLDRRAATTHWRFADDVAARFPSVRLDADAIFIIGQNPKMKEVAQLIVRVAATPTTVLILGESGTAGRETLLAA